MTHSAVNTIAPIIGAAVYFDPSAASPVTVEWLDQALGLLALSGVPVREFEIRGARAFDESVLHPYLPNTIRLRDSFLSESPTSAGLYCQLTEGLTVLQPQAMTDISHQFGCAFLGLLPRVGLSLAEVLLATHRLARVVARPAYGIAYLRSGQFGTAEYAKGFLGKSTTLPYEEDLITQDRICKWLTEILGDRRYLRGGFRSVYPVQLLSDDHRQAKLVTGETVAELKLGTWTPTDDGLWLWELTDAEVAEAKVILDRSGLLLAA